MWGGIILHEKENRCKQGKALFEFKGESLAVNLAGIDNTTICHLALHGLHDILNHRVNPKKSWQSIRNGQLTREKKIPAIIHAITAVYDIPLIESLELWNKMDADQKINLRNDYRIKLAIIGRKKGKTFDIHEIINRTI